MYRYIPKNLIKLASVCRFPLYLVGGSVRDFLAGTPLGGQTDWDICAAACEQELLAAAKECGFRAVASYRNTGTVKLKDKDGIGYEFARFRTDRYVRGTHSPAEILFTDDMGADARRRDFCANAVYYEIARGEFCDPLGGIADIKARKLRTVAPADKVFGEDGLRLMRLARIAAQTGFSPDGECLDGAKKHAALIADIAPERIFTELCLLLNADGKRADREAPYRGLCILRDTGVLGMILPELAAGAGMEQRKDFHDHDVLEHSLRCVKYAPPEIRLAALLHDAGKPYCYRRDGNFYAHAEEGARIAEEILTRLKAPKKTIEETAALVRLHMRDHDLKMREGKIRREIVGYYPLLPKLLALKQADYTACKDEELPAPSVVKWRNVLAKMEQEGAPFTLADLQVNGRDLQEHGVKAANTGRVLHELLLYCAEDGRRNKRDHLLKRIEKHYSEDL